jgi:Na+-transporting methylmalonyl-CoA/oxaloacetate decarboxylase gamma subunit
MIKTVFLFVEWSDISRGLLLSLVGMAAVFAILALFMLIIKLLSWVTDSMSQRALQRANLPVAPIKGEQVSRGELKLIDCSEKDAALIMAIVADNSGISLENLRFNSIKLIKEEEEDK